MKKSIIYKKKIIIFSIIIIFIWIISGIFLFIYNCIDIKLNGDKVVNTLVNNPYIDEGIVIKKDDKELDKSKYSLEIKNNVNTSIIGKYKVKYKVKYLWNTYKIERIVNVIDDIKPEININVDKIEKDYCTNKIITDYSYKSIDNYDGDITNGVSIEEKEEELIFTSIDKSGNTSILKYPITIINNDKLLNMNGNSTIYLTVGDKYTDAGAVYKDECGNDLSNMINTTGIVDTSKEGTYYITYNADDKSITRKIIVSNYQSANGKILYLTFDDGPGVYTERVLNTLAKYNVKATFFVTHQFDNYVNLIKREYEEGHAIGVHTYTHNWNVYSSVDNYLDDFNKMQNDIKTYTGSESKIFRFPGGSSNEVSISYSKGVVSSVASHLTNEGYVYFDWDVDSGDASGGSSSSIYNKVVSGATWCNQCVILMHDIKYNTVNELDNILNTLTRRGYTFKTLNTSSPTAHQRIVN